jgi:hypothetical protein
MSARATTAPATPPPSWHWRAPAHTIGDVTGLQTTLDGKAASSHSHAIADVTGLQTALDAKAPLASPALTGTPTAPTPANGTNTTQLATTAFVRATRLDQLAQPTADVPPRANQSPTLASPSPPRPRTQASSLASSKARKNWPMPHPYHHPTVPIRGHPIEITSGPQTVFAKN